MTAPMQVHDYVLMALQMTLKDNYDAKIVDLNYGNASEIVRLWSNYHIEKFDDTMISVADCVLCLEPVTIENIEVIQEKVEQCAKSGPVAFICFTNDTINIFEWFVIQQIYTYATPTELLGSVYFNIMTFTNTKED